MEAAARQEQYGLNEFEHETRSPWWVRLWRCYANPFSLLLSTLAAVSWLTDDLKASATIGTMVIIATVLRFSQETRSGNAMEQLKALVSNSATVRRVDEQGVPVTVELPIEQLVPGDIVLLAAGDMIPADMRLLQHKDLFVNQSAMTGESLPVEKWATPPEGTATQIASSPLDIGCLCFLGTSVVSGSGLAVVLGTGRNTYFGTLAKHVLSVEHAPTQFQAGINQVSWLLIRFMLVMSPLVLLINGFTKGDWLEAALFALAVAVGLTPEMLPMIVTSTLAKGAVSLSRRKVIVKRLDALQNFGAMDVLCTDKTGTLTENRVVLGRHIDAFGNHSNTTLQLAYLNSMHQTGLKNLLDAAVASQSDQIGGPEIASRYPKVDEIPFDFSRRRMSVIVREQAGHRLICKGAVEETLSVCSSVRMENGDEPATVPLTSETLPHILAHVDELNQEGFRVVAVASRLFPEVRTEYERDDEQDLCLYGFMAFLDPPKASTEEALKALAEEGVEVKVLTGDNERVTLKVCKDTGLNVRSVLLGTQIDDMDDAALGVQAAQCTVFAKLSPLQKERLVRVLRDRGHVVGFMGDGVNDAPALHAADIGISVNTAVDIAKEAADLILLEQSLMVLQAGVVEGRKTFVNMLKYIKITASSNFGNVLTVVVAGLFLPFLPMLPIHLLLLNLMYDFSQGAIPFDSVDEEQLRMPQKWNSDDLKRFMLYFGPLSSVFDILLFILMYGVFLAQTPAQQTLFQSGWFVESLLSQTFVVHMLRTAKIPFIQSIAAWPLLLVSAVLCGLGIFLVQGPLAPVFRFEALPGSYFVWLIPILLGYVLLAHRVKAAFIRRYGWQ